MSNNDHRTISKIIFAAVVLAVAVCVIPASKTGAATRVNGVINLGGYSKLFEEYAQATSDDNTSAVSLLSEQLELPDNVAIANVVNSCNIRSGPGTNYGTVGYLPVKGYCVVEDVVEEGKWAKIKSGNVSGYICTDYLFMGEEAKKYAHDAFKKIATIKASGVNFRSEPSTAGGDETVIGSATYGQVFTVIEETVFSKDGDDTEWVMVYGEDDANGYIYKEFVDISYNWNKAVSNNMLTTSSNTTSLRGKIVAEAAKHIGLRYVWGGESLSNGADCSGFCRACYRACGVDISDLDRTSYGMAGQSLGKTVSYANAQPGDLVFYGNSSGHVDHVAIYAGNGEIIHESGRKEGCKRSSINYRKVIKIKSFLD